MNNSLLTKLKSGNPQIAVNNCLFYPGVSARVMGTWNFYGDGTTEADRNAFLTWGNAHFDPGTKTIVINILNEDQMSPFKHGLMSELDNNRITLIQTWSQRLIDSEWMIVYAMYDGPASGHGKYHPIISCPPELHRQFLSLAIPFLNNYATGYMVGCETNRYFPPEYVEAGIACIKEFAGGRPVGTHMCWNPANYRIPAGLDFLAYEHSWSPDKGDAHSLADCVNEVRARQALLPDGFPFWPCEWNLNPTGSMIIKQALAMAGMKDVRGIGGPLR